VLDKIRVPTSVGGERTWSFDDPPGDMIDLARRVGAVFPNIPLLGLDILRCKSTGKAHVLEINAGGNVWHYSSQLAAKERATHPDHFPSAEQKQRSFEMVAEILIRKAIAAAS